MNAEQVRSVRRWFERTAADWDLPITALVMHEGVDPQTVCRGRTRALPQIPLDSLTADPGD